jgi:large subunit ribosomal protein L13
LSHLRLSLLALSACRLAYWAAAPDERKSRVRTFSPKQSDITRAWHLVDAEGMVLGRLASEVARVLRGKHKPIYAPHVDTGDFVVVINASKISVDPKKGADKRYYRHSQYPGGFRSENLESLMARNPERVLRLAVKGMLPKGPLGRQMLKKLKIHPGPTHPHTAQQPQPLQPPYARKARTA